MEVWRKITPGKGAASTKVLRQPTSLVHSRNMKEAESGDVRKLLGGRARD